MTKSLRKRPFAIGKKLGMTHFFTEEGEAIPVTVIELGENIITDIKTPEKHGYAAIQIGAVTKKDKHLNKPKLGNLKKKNLPNLSCLREFTVQADELTNYKISEKLDISKFLIPNEFIDASGTSIGKGFQGMVKLHNKSRGFRSHGSKSIRGPGSIGGHTFPGRVFPGKRMPSRMGNEKVTAKNLKVIELDKDKNILLVRGAVPGKEGTILTLTPSIKKWNVAVTTK